MERGYSKGKGQRNKGRNRTDIDDFPVFLTEILIFWG